MNVLWMVRMREISVYMAGVLLIGATGKANMLALREAFRDRALPTA